MALRSHGEGLASPGVVVLHEVFGVNADRSGTILSRCKRDRFRAERRDRRVWADSDVAGLKHDACGTYFYAMADSRITGWRTPAICRERDGHRACGLGLLTPESVTESFGMARSVGKLIGALAREPTVDRESADHGQRRRRLVVQIRPQPSFNFSERHVLAVGVIGNLILLDFPQAEVARFRMREVEPADA